MVLDITSFKNGSQKCIVIFQYNLYIFVWILHGCLTNTVYAVDPNYSVIKRLWYICCFEMKYPLFALLIIHCQDAVYAENVIHRPRSNCMDLQAVDLLDEGPIITFNMVVDIVVTVSCYFYMKSWAQLFKTNDVVS